MFFDQHLKNHKKNVEEKEVCQIWFYKSVFFCYNSQQISCNKSPEV